MTEWGGDQCSGSFEQQSECNFVQNLADLQLQSWAFWGMTSSFANGSLTLQETEILSRTYAQAVAGKIFNMSYDRSSRHFEVCFELDSSIAEPTVIFIAASTFYKGSPVINTTSNVVASFK